MGRDLLANPGMKGRSTAPARVFCTDIARMVWPWGDDPTVTMWEFLWGDGKRVEWKAETNPYPPSRFAGPDGGGDFDATVFFRDMLPLVLVALWRLM